MNDNELPVSPPAPAPWVAPTPQIVKTSAVESSIARIEESLVDLQDLLDVLLRRIEPVLAPQAPPPEAPCVGMPPRAAASVVVSCLLSKAETIEAITKRIAAATARVEL